MRFLLIQTAFIGDVILATGLPEKLKRFYPEAQIDFLVRKGNESLLENNPNINRVLIWDKKTAKYRNLLGLIRHVRKNRYDYVINLQRFAAMGFLTAWSGARFRIGFDKSPFKRKYTTVVTHNIDGRHEVDRNHDLIRELTDSVRERPKLYPSDKDRQSVLKYTEKGYTVIAPASVWFTKQTPVAKWIDLCNLIPGRVYLIGAPDDRKLNEEIIKGSTNQNIRNLAGELSLMQSAALIERAGMTYSNDSAPMHMASALNAPVTAVYCSTVPAFGFGPLSDNHFILETPLNLECRPCGLHGYAKCPLGHFKCGTTLEMIVPNEN